MAQQKALEGMPAPPAKVRLNGDDVWDAEVVEGIEVDQEFTVRVSVVVKRTGLEHVGKDAEPGPFVQLYAESISPPRRS